VRGATMAAGDVLRRPDSGGAQDRRREARTSVALALRSARRGASGASLLCFSIGEGWAIGFSKLPGGSGCVLVVRR
jgi:hypothetical protein